MAAQHPEIVIVRRRSSHEGEHHGGTWKIAFADFMTAMMAFFLVLWIISATDKNTKTLIARYFNPVKVEEPAKAQKGIHGVPEKDAYQPGAGSAAPSAGRSTSERVELAGDRMARRRRRMLRAKASNGARRRRSRLSRPRIRQNPTRRCRSRNCSAIHARVLTKSPARRRQGLGLILRRR
jgi:flagellar motor protein MotB